jgi:hypothetical protein
MESHDEERMMYKAITYGSVAQALYKIKGDTTRSLKRIELAANFFFTIPGPKMIWQFEELGYDYSIEYGGGRLAKKPVRWDYQNQWRRRYTKNIFSSLIDLKKTQPAFATTDYSIDLTTAIKRIWLRHSTMDVTVLGNFDVIAKNVIPTFTKTGMWYEYYTGDSLNVTDVSAYLAFDPGEYRIYTTVKLQKPVFTGIDDELLPQLLNNKPVLVYPNPSGGLFNLAFELPRPSAVEVTIFNMLGHAVKKVSVENAGAGINNVSVDLSAERGSKPASGIYFFRLNAGSLQETGKLIVK